MAKDVLVMVDPDPERRRDLARSCRRRGLEVHEVSTLGEGRGAAARLDPARVAVAGVLADLYEFSIFLEHVGAGCIVVYGPVRRRVAGAHYLPAPGRAAAAEEWAARLSDLRSMAASPASAAPPPRPFAPFCAAPAAAVVPDPGIESVILIGASTGGVVALETVLSDFPPDCPPTLIVQHMREGYAESMVRRFDQLLRPRVLAAEDGIPLARGVIQIAVRNSHHLGLQRRGGVLQSRLIEGPPHAGHCPSVSVLFAEAARLAPRVKLQAALLTGMGNDGASGMEALHHAGAHTIAQDQDSSVVWGMPRAAIEAGAVDEVLPLSAIARALLGEAAASPVSGRRSMA